MILRCRHVLQYDIALSTSYSESQVTYPNAHNMICGIGHSTISQGIISQIFQPGTLLSSCRTLWSAQRHIMGRAAENYGLLLEHYSPLICHHIPCVKHYVPLIGTVWAVRWTIYAMWPKNWNIMSVVVQCGI
jgi:hypothetical protein